MSSTTNACVSLNQHFLLRCLFIQMLSITAVFATERESPPIVTAPEVKHMLENMSDSLLIHSLSEIEYRIQHIPGSINIPVTEMDSTPLLPRNKQHRLIFYCMGDKCSYSERACHKAIDMGYEQVFWFRGGIPEWRRFNYPLKEELRLKNMTVPKLSPVEVEHLLEADPSIVLLDVRPLWWKDIPRAIAGSLFMPLVALQKDYVQFVPLHTFILVDGYMKQSPAAAKFLMTKNYHVLGVLKGGIGRWEKEGFPTVPKAAQQP